MVGTNRNQMTINMKTLISFIVCLCCATGIYAQLNLYKETKQIQGEGYTYQCKVSSTILVDLYNIEQQFVEKDQVNRNTGKYSSIKDAYTPQLEQDSWTRSKCFSIVRNAFSEEQKQRLKGQLLDISLYIHPDTGKVIDVMFSFTNRENFAIIPISVYRKIELELKKNIWFTPTEHGKQFNYICRWWSQMVSK